VELLATGSGLLCIHSFCSRSIYAGFEAKVASASSHSELPWQASLASADVLLYKLGQILNIDPGLPINKMQAIF
jgi:hypothetical protein